MTKLNLLILFLLSFSFMGISQKSNEELIHKKWYFCDTTFYYNSNEVVKLTNDENYCKNPVNDKRGSLDIKYDGTFILINYSPCGPPIPTETGFIIDGCVSKTEGNFRVEKNHIWLNDIKFNIDVIDERYLLLRKEITEK